MATIIWCDKVRHVVQESQTEVADTIEHILSRSQGTNAPNGLASASPFVYFTIAEIRGEGLQQRALNANLISSFEAMPGDSV